MPNRRTVFVWLCAVLAVFSGAMASTASLQVNRGSDPDLPVGRDANWTSNYILNSSANNGTRRDIAIGKYIKGTADETTRVVCPLWNASSNNVVSMFTDTSTVPSVMKWRSENIQTQPNGLGASSVAIGDVDGDGQNEIVFGQLNTTGSSQAVALKCAKWVGGNWNIVTIATRTVGTDFGIREVVIGDADNNPATNNEVFAVAGPYLLRAIYSAGSWTEATLVTHPSPLNARISSVTIGRFDDRFGTDNCVAATISPWNNQYGFIELHYNGVTYDTMSHYWPGSQYWYDIACGDIDASIPGEELVVNNGGDLANSHAVYQVWVNAAGIAQTWGLYKPPTSSGWGNYADIAVGDFCTQHPGAEVVAVPGTVVASARALWGDYYGSGQAWSEVVFTPTTGWTCGVAVGNFNKWRDRNEEIAIASSDDIYLIEQSWPTNDLAVIQVWAGTPPLVIGQPATVTARIQNLGTAAQANFAVSYSPGDGNLPVTETYPGTLGSGQTVDYTFTQPLACATVGSYTLKAYTTLAGDAYRPNDTARRAYAVCPMTHTLPFVKDFGENWGPYADNPPFCGWRVHWTGTEPNKDDWMRHIGLPSKSGAYVGIWTGRHENAVDSLISPRIDCSGYSDITLSCWTSFDPRQASFTAELRASTDDGATWPILLRSYTHSGGPFEGTESFSLPAATNQPAVRFAWIATGDVYNIRRWLVDDVAVTGTLGVHDAGTDEITIPVSGVYPATPAPSFAPVARVRNHGTVTEPVPASFSLGSYTNTQTSGALAPGATAQLTFAPTGPLAAGYYEYYCQTTLTGDANPSNDSVGGQLLVMDAPTNLSVTPQSAGYVNSRRPSFWWNPLPGVAATQGYLVEVRDELGMVVFTAQPDAPGVTANVDLNDGNYTWRVRGINVLEGPWSEPAEFEVDATPPGVAQLLSPPDGQTAVPVQPLFDWSDVLPGDGNKAGFGLNSALTGRDAAPVRYNIVVRDPSNTVVASATGLETSTWACAVPLAGLTQHSWTVQAYDLAGNHGEWAAPFTFTTIIAAPEAVTLTSPADNAVNVPLDVDLVWQPAARADTYDVYFGTDNPPATLVSSQTGTVFDCGGLGLSNLTDYYWRVVARNVGGTSSSAVRHFTTIIAAPGVVTLTSPADNAVNVPLDVDLVWEPAARTESYDVFFGTDSPPTTIVSEQTGTVFDCGQLGLVNGTRYFWRIVANNAAGSAQSEVRKFTTIVAAPGPFSLRWPENLAGNIPTNGQLVWQASARADSYDVFLDVVDPPVTLFARGVRDTVQTYAGLATGTTYFWRVVARNAGGSTPSTRTWSFTTAGRATFPRGWYARETLPGPIVKDGGALVANPDRGCLYALKGNKRDEFYQYSPSDSAWTRLADVTAGNRPVGKGAAMTYGGGMVFVMKGNNTRDFYKYDVAGSTWLPARSVPLASDQSATRGKAVKGGGSLAYVYTRDSSFVYALKGSGTNEFYRYDVARDTFFSLAAAPYVTKPKYDKGSWIAYDGSQFIYLMQNKYNALFRYDVLAEQWDTVTVLKRMPLVGQLGRNKKVGDGSCAAFNPDGGFLFAMKGNNTQEAWKYLPGANDTWVEVETIPQAYAGGKKKKVKAGAGAAYYPDFGVFFVQKGNKSNQFWMYSPGAVAYTSRPQREGISASGLTAGDCQLTITPNPLAGGQAVVRYSLPRPGTVSLSVCDIAGRVVLVRTLAASRTGNCRLDLRELRAGTYIVRLSSDGQRMTHKIVVSN